MAIVYRDYGSIGYGNAPNNAFESVLRRQVYLATHRGDGTRLPFMNRSFISFTYGGRRIEDFDLIATFLNDKLSKEGYASFEDTVTTYSNLNGQSYWSTHYRTNTLEFTLSTDGIELKTLDEFLYWFHAGEAKELILAEHPNRAIIARVALPPQLSLLPFEHNTVLTINGYGYDTKTTLYKGDITLTFTMDTPFWYAIDDIIGTQDSITVNGVLQIRYINKWKDTSDDIVKEVSVFESPDALKILIEDGIPLASMISHDMLLGNGTVATVEENIWSKIWKTNVGGAYIEGEVNGVMYYGKIAGPVIDGTGRGVDVDKNVKKYFYYAGTAPAPTIITFKMTPTLNGDYIRNPSNDFKKNSSTGKPYDIITIEGRKKQELRFTTPNVFTSYNMVINIFKTYVKSGSTKTWLELQEKIREEIRHVHVRNWATKVINDYKNNNNIGESLVVVSSALSELISKMREFLLPDTTNTSTLGEVEFIFNSETGEAIGIFGYRNNISSPNTFSTNIEENVGDMLCSNYITITERNHPTTEGFIVRWTNANDNTKTQSHCLYHNVGVTLSGLKIKYKNMYL